MNRFFILLLCLLTCSPIAAQRAVTDEGKIVILRSDGTWKFESPDSTPDTKIATNSGTFRKDASSTFALKSTKNSSMFWVDINEWKFEKSTEGKAHEYTFNAKDGSDLYGLAITEAISMDVENLGEIALSNAKGVIPDIKIVKREFRVVNGVRVLYQEMVGTTSGMRLKYLGYYFSDPSGTTQFLLYTGEDLAPKFEARIAKFLSGFSVQK